MTTPERPPIAGRIVYRHRCHCDNANVKPLAGEGDEHRFDVDGAPFPWYITEEGARFSKAGVGLYLVEVDILGLEADGNHNPLDITLSYWRKQPRIGERPFPWAITGDEIMVTQEAGGIPILHLEFLAFDVDTDGEITDLTRPRPVSPDDATAASLEAEDEDMSGPDRIRAAIKADRGGFDAPGTAAGYA